MSVPSSDAGANLSGDDNIAPVTPTGEEEQPNLKEQEGDNSDEGAGEGDDVKENLNNQEGEEKGTIPYPRFKTIVDEKNLFKDENSQLKQRVEELEANQKTVQSQVPDKSQIPTSNERFDFGQYNDLFGENTYPFKKPNEYKDFGELFSDMRAAMMHSLMNANQALVDKKVSEQKQTEEKLDNDIQDLRKYFGEDVEKRDAFFKVVEKVVDKTKTAPDLYSLLAVFEETNGIPKGKEGAGDDSDIQRKKTNSKINRSTNKSGKSVSATGYNPSMHKDMDMDDVLGLFNPNS